jgi:hypothetical protein
MRNILYFITPFLRQTLHFAAKLRIRPAWAAHPLGSVRRLGWVLLRREEFAMYCHFSSVKSFRFMK